MKTKIQELKEHLAKLTFARVSRVIAKDEEIISFEGKQGFTVWSSEPSFERERAEFSRNEWLRTEKSYSHYFGFANGIYFQMKNQIALQYGSYANLGIDVPQRHGTPPQECDWIVGYDILPERPRFYKWSLCLFQEVRFADMLLGRCKTTAESVESLVIQRIGAQKDNDRLVHLARLLIQRDLQYYLIHRTEHTDETDLQVGSILKDFDPELWENYREIALSQHIYSRIIPEPAPMPIRDDLTGSRRMSAPLLTPFVGLELKS